MGILTIFDWDDTLLNTTHIFNEMERLDVKIDEIAENPDMKKFLLEIDIISTKLVTETLKHGDVWIITNSKNGWCQWSCKQFLPKLWKVIEQIPIISAQFFYESYFKELNQSTIEWKFQTMNFLIKDGFDQVLIVGDSEDEIISGLKIKHIRKYNVTTIKFVPDPDSKEILRQQNEVLLKLSNILINLNSNYFL